MVYQGQVKNGVIVFENEPPLAEGTSVRIEPLPKRRSRPMDHLPSGRGLAISRAPHRICPMISPNGMTTTSAGVAPSRDRPSICRHVLLSGIGERPRPRASTRS